MMYQFYCPENNTQYRMLLKSAFGYLTDNPGKKLLLLPSYIAMDSAIIFKMSREDALKSIADKHAEMLAQATGGATAAERDTWIVKEREANSVVFDGATASDALIPLSGETLMGLAAKILVKATAYRQLVGVTDMIKRTAEKAVESLPLESIDDLDALDAALETAKKQAMAALTAATSPTP